MKRLSVHTSVVAALLAVIALVPTVSRAENRCDEPRSMIDQRACAKAAEGKDALRNFVSRTRMIWNLYYWDYAPRDNAAVAGTRSSATAELAQAVRPANSR
jgi:hypothetical protein